MLSLASFSTEKTFWFHSDFNGRVGGAVAFAFAGATAQMTGNFPLRNLPGF